MGKLFEQIRSAVDAERFFVAILKTADAEQLECAHQGDTAWDDRQ